MMLKVDFHIHTKEDPRDKYIRYNAKEIIDLARNKDFNALSITNHNNIYFNSYLDDYAKSKGILLIPGAEALVDGKEVLIYTEKSYDTIKEINKILKKRKLSFKSLKTLKEEGKIIMAIAPHPFFIYKSLGKMLHKNKDALDAVEYSFFYTNHFNLNKKAEHYAKNNNMALMSFSDLHYINFFGRSYTLIKSEKNINSIVREIKKNNIIKIYSEPLTFFNFFWHTTKILFHFF